MAKTGFMVFADHRTGGWWMRPRLCSCVPALQETGLDVIVWDGLVNSEHEGVHAAKSLQAQGVGCLSTTVHVIEYFSTDRSIATTFKTVTEDQCYLGEGV
jgi:hypothetical protein